MFGCVVTVWYEGLIVKEGMSVRGIWRSKTRGGVGDGDSGMCVGVDSMRVVARECNFVLHVGVSMCELAMREGVTCFSVNFLQL